MKGWHLCLGVPSGRVRLPVCTPVTGTPHIWTRLLFFSFLFWVIFGSLFFTPFFLPSPAVPIKLMQKVSAAGPLTRLPGTLSIARHLVRRLVGGTQPARLSQYEMMELSFFFSSFLVDGRP